MPNDEKVMITESHLYDIADAIREQNGQSDTYIPAQMAPAIRALSPGVGLLAAEYNPSTAYGKGNHVMYDGKYYVSNQATTGTFNPDHWDETQVGREITLLQRDLDNTEVWDKLIHDILPNTIQDPVYTSGQLTGVRYRTTGNSLVREDSFSISGNTMTETRRLATGQTLIINTNLDSLQSVITYAEVSA